MQTVRVPKHDRPQLSEPIAAFRERARLYQQQKIVETAQTLVAQQAHVREA